MSTYESLYCMTNYFLRPGRHQTCPKGQIAAIDYV